MFRREYTKGFIREYALFWLKTVCSGPGNQCRDTYKSLNCLRAIWELEGSQRRPWSTTKVARVSRRSCSSSIGGGAAQWWPRGAQLSVSAAPADFFLTQQRPWDDPEAFPAEQTCCPPLDVALREELQFHFSHTSYYTWDFSPSNPFLRGRVGVSTESSLWVLLGEGGEEAERRSVLVLLGRAVCVQGLLTYLVRSSPVHLQFLSSTIRPSQPSVEDRDSPYGWFTTQIPPASGWFSESLKSLHFVSLNVTAFCFMPHWLSRRLPWQWPFSHSAGVTSNPCSPASSATGL